jgi:hypothetical protein
MFCRVTGYESSLWVGSASEAAKTVPEFIAYAKGNPGKVNMAPSGGGKLPAATLRSMVRATTLLRSR